MVLASHKGPEKVACDSAGWAVAGLLASQHAWEDFGGAWQAAARRGPTHCDLSRLMSDRKIAGIGAVISPPNRAMIRSPEMGSFFLQFFPDSSLLCLEHCVLEAARRLQPAPAGETVCFVMDWNEPLASSALWHLEDLLSATALPLRERLGALGFESSLDFPPLQAAHWLAARCYEVLSGTAPCRNNAQWLDCTMIEDAPQTRSRDVLQTI